MSIGNANWLPNPANVGDTIRGTVPATITPSATGAVAYSWTAGQVWSSVTGVSGTFAPYSGNCVIGWPSGTNSPSPTFNALFFDAGHYIVQVNASARITNVDGTTTALSATGYIGGSQSDISSNDGTGHVVPLLAGVGSVVGMDVVGATG